MWSIAMAAEPIRLDPVVVTGTQIAVPVSELPSAITVIEREEIESRQITDVQQLLRTVPGLSVTQSGSRGGQTKSNHTTFGTLYLVRPPSSSC